MWKNYSRNMAGDLVPVWAENRFFDILIAFVDVRAN
jgi:hypothetical protein